jgi:hypothetical protein
MLRLPGDDLLHRGKDRSQRAVRGDQLTYMPSVNSVECDWCWQESHAHVPAKYVVCTGRIDTMRIKESFICDYHAEKLVSEFQGVRGMIGGTSFDEWELHWITEGAREFYIERTAQRISDAAKRAARNQGAAARTRNIPYTLSEPDRWGVQRGGGFYRNPREIRESPPFHGVCVGDGAALWNRSDKRS